MEDKFQFEEVLASGAVLKGNVAPWAVSKGLWQAVLKVVKETNIAGKDLTDVYKDLFTGGFSSTEVETYLKACMGRCLYCPPGKDPFKITDETFEEPSNRQDYLKVCIIVAKANCDPFVKGLYAEFGEVLGKILPSQK